MRRAEAFLIVAMALSCGACVLRKPQPVSAAPVAPRPAPPPAPAPPPEPLSIPQTNVFLPPPQPVTPEALATTMPADEPPPPAPAPLKPPVRPATPRGTPARVEQAAPPPAATPESDRAPISELTPPSELKRLQDEANARRQEVNELIRQIPRRQLHQQQNSVERINAFLKQATEAEERGDMRQASELASRALVLARELK